ncbi:MAG: ABC transporter permease [Spirochaetia bacterium]|nr:ABC transporter permease [Spirochaetia bacterium]
MLNSILIEGLIYGIMVLGVFSTFRVLNFCDMTVDGSFPLGACVLAACLTAGIPPVAAIFIAFLSGLVAGIATSAIYTKLKIPDLLAGILTMTMLYSVNLRIMSNKANISFLKIDTLFSKIQDKAYDFFFDMGLEFDVEWALVFFLIVFVAVLKILMDLFYHTDLGLTMGALGSNPQLIVSQGVNPDIVRTIGICFGNGLAALAGSFAAMYNGFADVGMGTGIVVSGLASLMLGEFIIKSNRIGLQTLRVFIGSIVYRALMILARSYGYKIHITPNDLKLVTGILIIICLIVSRTDLINRLKSRKK